MASRTSPNSKNRLWPGPNAAQGPQGEAPAKPNQFRPISVDCLLDISPDIYWTRYIGLSRVLGTGRTIGGRRDWPEGPKSSDFDRSAGCFRWLWSRQRRGARPR